ncbi:MAG: hypothetical protein V4691_08340 [Pseudomonadota bacterium]
MGSTEKTYRSRKARKHKTSKRKDFLKSLLAGKGIGNTPLEKSWFGNKASYQTLLHFGGPGITAPENKNAKPVNPLSKESLSPAERAGMECMTAKINDEEKRYSSKSNRLNDWFGDLFGRSDYAVKSAEDYRLCYEQKVAEFGVSGRTFISIPRQEIY